MKTAMFMLLRLPAVNVPRLNHARQQSCRAPVHAQSRRQPHDARRWCAQHLIFPNEDMTMRNHSWRRRPPRHGPPRRLTESIIERQAFLQSRGYTCPAYSPQFCRVPGASSTSWREYQATTTCDLQWDPNLCIKHNSLEVKHNTMGPALTLAGTDSRTARPKTAI